MACHWGSWRLDTDCRRAFWDGQDVGLTLGEYNIVHLLASQPGIYVKYRAIYDYVHSEGFLAGRGPNGYQVNVRNAIKNIRKKFCACDPAFNEIRTFSGFGYCWRQAVVA
jgi:two-component system, OmpR family, response regulator ChvI